MLTKKQMTIGAVFTVTRYRGEAENFTGEVVAVRDTWEDSIHPKIAQDGLWRSRYLVTLKALPGQEAESPVKSYYHRFAEAQPCQKVGSNSGSGSQPSRAF